MMGEYFRKMVRVKAWRVPEEGCEPSDELSAIMAREGWKFTQDGIEVRDPDYHLIGQVADYGDWIVRATDGSYFARDPSEFEEIYSPVDDEPTTHQPGTWAWACDVGISDAMPELTHGDGTEVFQVRNRCFWRVQGRRHVPCAVTDEMIRATDWRVMP